MNQPDNNRPGRNKNSKQAWMIGISAVLGIGVISFCLLFFLWLRPKYFKPLSEPLDSTHESTMDKTADPSPVDLPHETDLPVPVCGDTAELTVLIVGADYRGANYLYGLADVIRIVHVDFTVPHINVAALPRALLIPEPAPRLDVTPPILINQAYLYGTEGMGHYSGPGYGAGALAETLEANFDLQIDNYLVLDFRAFVNFIDNLGGIQVDLPLRIEDGPNINFPAGVQVINGEEALQIARHRKDISDNARIDNQTIIIQGILEKLLDPATILRLPQLVSDLSHTIMTDATPQQIQNAICLLGKIGSEDVRFFNPGEDLISDERVFIPTMNKEMNVFVWDQDLAVWLTDSLTYIPDDQASEHE